MDAVILLKHAHYRMGRQLNACSAGLKVHHFGEAFLSWHVPFWEEKTFSPILALVVRSDQERF